MITKTTTQDFLTYRSNVAKKISRMQSVQFLKEVSSQVRRDILRMTHGVQSGHPGGSLGCTDFLVALYL